MTECYCDARLKAAMAYCEQHYNLLIGSAGRDLYGFAARDLPPGAQVWLDRLAGLQWYASYCSRTEPPEMYEGVERRRAPPPGPTLDETLRAAEDAAEESADGGRSDGDRGSENQDDDRHADEG